VSLLTGYLQTPAGDQLWFFNPTSTGYSYNLILNSLSISNAYKLHPFVDLQGQLHLILLNQAKKAYYLLWDNHSWRRTLLPVTKWDELLTYIDSANNFHTLAKTPVGFQYFYSMNKALSAAKRINIPETCSRPLFFTADQEIITLYLLDKSGTTLKVLSASRQTGQVLSADILLKNHSDLILKHWVVEEALILVVKDLSSGYANLYLMRIDLLTKKQSVTRSRIFNFDSYSSYHLLADPPTMLLLISSSNDFFYFSSSDNGQNWTYPQQSHLLSPLTFQEICTINNRPSSLIGISSIKGCSLERPLVISLSELAAIL
jgi:hypothetical protein